MSFATAVALGSSACFGQQREQAEAVLFQSAESIMRCRLMACPQISEVACLLCSGRSRGGIFLELVCFW